MECWRIQVHSLSLTVWHSAKTDERASPPAGDPGTAQMLHVFSTTAKGSNRKLQTRTPSHPRRLPNNETPGQWSRVGILCSVCRSSTKYNNFNSISWCHLLDCMFFERRFYSLFFTFFPALLRYNGHNYKIFKVRSEMIWCTCTLWKDFLLLGIIYHFLYLSLFLIIFWEENI